MYLLKRILWSIPIVIAISFISFMIIHLAPGDYLSSLSLNPLISPETVSALRKEFGLDKPVIIQYVLWLKNALCLDFGYSFTYRIPVTFLILNRLCNTLILGLLAFILSWILVIPLGLISALKKDSLFDKFIKLICSLSIGMPSFFLALLMLCIASKTSFLPLGGSQSVSAHTLNFGARILDLLRHAFLPTITLTFLTIGPLIAILRASAIEVLSTPYIQACYARGMKEDRILLVHVLKNAANPLITILGYQLSALISGAAFIEIIFAWPGLGQLMLTAVLSQDLYLIMANLFISSFLLLWCNIFADVLLKAVDPRIRM